jgi:predicted nucleotidyltransferase
MAEAGRDADIARLARRHPGLRLLVLFGSRARAETGPRSDWDLGYLAGPPFDPDALLAELVEALGADRVDLVDLDRAGAQLRYRVAAEARVLHTADPEAFPRFWMDAVSFWCDAGPLIEAGYRDVLARLPS